MQFRKIIIIVSLVLASSSLLYYFLLDSNNNLQTYHVLSDRKNITFVVDSEFSKDEINKIEASAREWVSRVGSLNIKFVTKKLSVFDIIRFGSDKYSTIYKASVPGIKKDIGTLAAGSYFAIGLSIITSGDIFIFISDKNFGQVIKHEIGHVLIGKAWHSNNPLSVMYPYTNGLNTEITSEDVMMVEGE